MNSDIKEIEFKGLPFAPDTHVFMYVEEEYNTEVNAFIQENYENIKTNFKEKGFQFIYLPYLTIDWIQKGILQYHAPYLNLSDNSTKLSSNWILQFVVKHKEKEAFQPSLIFWDRSGKAYNMAIRNSESITERDLTSFFIIAPSHRYFFKESLQNPYFNAKIHSPSGQTGAFDDEDLAYKAEAEERERIRKESAEAKKQRAEEAERKRRERERKKNSFFSKFKRGFDNMTGDLFGFDDNNPLTLEEVGQRFGVTRERIRQREAKGLRQMRYPARSKNYMDFWK